MYNIQRQTEKQTKNLVERHINVVAATFHLASDVVIVRLTKVRPKRSMFIAMNRKIQNPTIIIASNILPCHNVSKLQNLAFCRYLKGKLAVKVCNFAYWLLTQL